MLGARRAAAAMALQRLCSNTVSSSCTYWTSSLLGSSSNGSSSNSSNGSSSNSSSSSRFSLGSNSSSSSILVFGRQISTAVLSATAAAAEYKVEQWTETPYLEYIVGLEPEGSTLVSSTGGSTLAGVRGEQRRPHPGYTARLVRLRIENASSVKAREAILDEKSYMRDFGRFWLPMLADLLGGAHHQHSLEIFEWFIEHPTLLKSARKMELQRLYTIMISYAGVIGKAMLARRWFDDIEQRGMPKSSQCCNALVIAYAKSCDVESALAILGNMNEYQRECPPNAMTFYILIAMYARLRQWTDMHAMLRACRDAGFSIDMITYSTLLCAYGRMKRPELFEATLQEAKQMVSRSQEQEQQQQQVVKLRDEVYGAMLFGYSQLDAPEKAMQVLTEIIEAGNAGAVPAVALEEIAAAYCRNGLVEGLENLVQTVEAAAPELGQTSSEFQNYVKKFQSDTGVVASRASVM